MFPGSCRCTSRPRWWSGRSRRPEPSSPDPPLTPLPRALTLAREKVTGLDIEIPKGIRALKSDLELASRDDFANWVEQQGGLPRKIKSVAKHLQAKGMGESQSIAVAVNVAKKACASGDTNWPGKQTINAKSKGEYCAAVARWEAMKAAAGGS